MIRIVPLALVLALIAPAPALADEPAPTPEQIESAKKAFAEGKKLHGEGKYGEAVEKFKESYRLSKNPLLLYNIGFTMDEAKEADMALFYYRKFLKEAPQDAEQRAAVTERVKLLEELFNPAQPAVDPAKEGPKKIEIKPPGTYSAQDFEHQVVDAAPPAKPLDVTASVPEDSGFVVTLFFRTAGEGKYASKEMKWRYKELVGRIPAPKMIGNSVQYYIEVKDTTGTLVTRSGKSTSPNLVNLEAGAVPRFYPDLTDEGEVLSDTEIRKLDDDDDPLNRNKKPPPEPIVKKPVEEAPPAPPATGFRDIGSRKFQYAKWGSTGVGALMVTLSALSYFAAVDYGRRLTADSEECGRPPCRPYDTYAAGLERSGKRYQTVAYVTAGIGVAAGAVAGYFWYLEYRAEQRAEVRRVSGKAKAPQPTSRWNVAPVLGDGAGGLFGATAARRF